MATWSDPRGSTPPTSQPRPPGVVVALSAGAAPGRVSASITWGRLGEHLIEMGWSVIPQTNGSDGQREPGRVSGSRGDPDAGKIRYKNQYAMHRQMPPARVVKFWRHDNQFLNVAGVPGDSPGYFGWFAIDIDILDPKLMTKVLELADRVLGRTPFLRGRRSSSRAALIYRRKLGPLRMPQSASGRPKVNYVLEAEVEIKKGQTEKQAIEIKDDGQLITFYGHHHAKLEPYVWLRDAEPYTAGPDIAPEVDEEQVLDFLGAVHALSPIVDYDKARRDYTKSPVQWADTDVSEVRMPPMSDDMANAVDLKDGRVDWLFKRSTPWARWNAGLVAPLVGAQRQVDPDGVSLVAAALLEESRLHIDYSITGKQLSGYSAHRIISEKVRSAAEKIARGEPGYDPVGTRRLNPITLVAEPAILDGVLQTDDEYSWLPKAKDRKRICRADDAEPVYRRTSPDAKAATAIGLIYDRLELMQRVAGEIRAAIMGWLDALWLHRQAIRDGKKIGAIPAHLLKAPTGAGKTTMLLRCLGEWKLANPGADLGPILMLLPSYANINEVAGRDDLGVWMHDQEERAARIIAEGRGAGIEAMIYRGKVAAGCFEAERVQALQAAGYNASGLCEAQVMEESEYDGQKMVEKVTKYCRYHPDNPSRDDATTPACNAILQRLQIAKSDLVLAPHSFLTTNIPRELREGIVAVVIDEKIWDKTIAIRIFPVDVFLAGRPEPELTKKEKAKNAEYAKEGKHSLIVDPVARWLAREDIGRMIHDVAKERCDLAHAIIEAGLGKQLDDAVWTTGRLQSSVMDLTPETSLTAIKAYTGAIKTRGLVDEHKTLKLVQERVDQFRNSPLIPLGHKLHKARGTHDARIQLVGDGQDLRICWRKELNFDDVPLLFLDASGNHRMLERIWGRDITVHSIEAPLFIRVVWVPDGSYAKSRILPARDDGQDIRLAKSSRQVMLREAMTTIALAHADGAVVGASALEVRKHLQRDWHQPPNLHYMHYGAVRGIDYAKFHSAAVSVGQLELRPVDLDAYVAAFTHDLGEPERPTDPFGNGRTGPGEDAPKIQRRLVDRVVQLRDGGTATVKVYEPEGEWARMVVEQVREEELSQFLGRLRPVYREGRAPTWYHFGRALPKGVVVDEVIAIEDVARPFGRTLPVTHEMAVGGVLTPSTTGGYHLSGLSDTAIAKAHATVSGSRRWQRGLYEIEYTAPGSSDMLHAFVPGWAGDPLRSLSEAVYDLSGARVVREPRPAHYQLPVEDKVDKEIGSREVRAAAYDRAMLEIGTRVDLGMLTYDEKRHGISHAGRAQAPHLFAAIEQMNKRVAAMTDAAKLTELDSLPAEHFMLDGMDEEAIAKVLEIYEAGMLPAILARAGVDVKIREKVIALRPPVDVSFGKPLETPAPANGDQPLPALPANVIRFGAFRPKLAAAATPPDAATG